MSELSVLLIGDASRSEFHEAALVIEHGAHVVKADDIDEAMQRLADGDCSPELIVLAQARPGQFALRQVARLQRAAPLARLMGLLGSQCEGETRTGQPWPGVQRAFWYQWPARWGEDLRRRARGDGPSWGQPPTSTPEDLLSATLAQRTACRGLIAIHTPHFEVADTLADECQDRGLASVWVQPHRRCQLQGVSAGLWDADRCDHAEAARLARFKQRIDGAPIGVLVDFPRLQHRQQFFAAGATFLVGRPFLCEELFGPLEQQLRSSESAAA